jgi:hypothetical protein
MDVISISILSLVGSNITLIDESNDRKLEFLELLNEYFLMTFIIGAQNQSDFDKINGLFFKNFNTIDEHFGTSIFYTNDHTNKLIIICDASTIHTSKTFHNLLINGPYNGCTVVFFNGLDDDLLFIKNIKLNTNFIISNFANDEMIKKSYNSYFTSSPTFNTFNKYITESRIINENKYFVIIKSGQRYYATHEKFRYIDHEFVSNNKYHNMSDNDLIDLLNNNRISLSIII